MNVFTAVIISILILSNLALTNIASAISPGDFNNTENSGLFTINSIALESAADYYGKPLKIVGRNIEVPSNSGLFFNVTFRTSARCCRSNSRWICCTMRNT